MNDRFTFSPDVGKLIRSSHDEARRLGHRWLEVEHLLLGILAEPECTAAEILHALRCDYSELKTAVEHAIQPCERDLPEIDGSPVKDMPLTKETEGVLRRSYEEADEAGDKEIGTKHILLSLLHDQEGNVARVMERACEITHERVRAYD